ncbi:hypothetical protein NQ314_002849 [Rhamnusium bicolor]|uniref:BTB domain-containing protein n=1 Tax=Rhamnusium bicolor TaxID=1586634 RepID=A0AAV8ZPJ3_9CUCU|nr:hypothetical protein NQ314_002849 [Rhamnusium bicolor]
MFNSEISTMSGKTTIKGNPSQYVKLNVGGCLHYTTIGTLTKHDTMLRAMFSGRMEVLSDSDGWILIDRCGKHFGTILNFLRDGSVSLPESAKEMAELVAEAKYYCIAELAESCNKALAKKERGEHEPICGVPLITSQKEEEMLIKVCCTSIVYATDKKHTKVECPEARIYEETLNILLYESRNAPDQELMQATSTRGAVSGMSSYTSDEEEERSGIERLRSNKSNNQA